MRNIGSELRVLLALTASLLLVQLLNSLTGDALHGLGLVPRQLAALPGILFAPWLHGGWLHLLSNLSGLLVLGGLLILRSRRDFLRASAFIVLGSGLLVWLFARHGLHIGASGWLFGLWGLLLARAWFQRQMDRCAAKHGDKWPEHREWLAEYFNEELREHLESKGVHHAV